MIGLTTLTSNGRPMAAPKLNRRRALFVLAKIDEILSWEKGMDRERDARFVDLGRFLCEVRSGQYWRLDNLKSFDEFLEKRFPESRRKAYYLMTIHEQLPGIPKLHLKQVGWSKATELAKVARRDGQQFDCATWLHRAQQMPKEEFKRDVERHLTGKETEPWEILYFKVYKSQLAVIEQALETAALMLGTGKSRGYCLEMIAADFLAGASLEPGAEDMLFLALARLIAILPVAQRLQLLEMVRNSLEPSSNRNGRDCALNPTRIAELTRQVLARDGWRCQDCGAARDLQVHHIRSRGRLGDDAEENLITLCAGCHRARHLNHRTP